MLSYIPKKKLLLFFGDVCIIAGGLLLVCYLCDVLMLYGLFIVTTLCYVIAMYIADLYNLSYRFKTTLYVARFVAAVCIGTGLTFPLLYMLRIEGYTLCVWLGHLLLILTVGYLWRLVFEWIFRYKKKPLNVLLIGDDDLTNELYEIMQTYDDYRVNIIGNPGDLLDKRIQTDSIQVIAADLTGGIKLDLLRWLLKHKLDGTIVCDTYQLYEQLTGKIPVKHISDVWLLREPFLGLMRDNYYIKVKRIMDVIIAVIGLILAMPVLAIVALAIKLDSKGPVLYRQNRVGLNERVFRLIKLRSMREDAESTAPKWADKDDPRVTRVGRFIRKFRIDEIPQLWNVIRGDMSIVGPRPERPEFVNQLKSCIPYYSLRHTVKPGMTGWAQVNYRYAASIDETVKKLQYDLFYIKHMSFILDLRIMLKTIRVLICGIGAR